VDYFIITWGLGGWERGARELEGTGRVWIMGQQVATEPSVREIKKKKNLNEEIFSS
jgi:hypothetical protein